VFNAAKIRKVERKTKKLISFFAETKYFRARRSAKIGISEQRTKFFLISENEESLEAFKEPFDAFKEPFDAFKGPFDAFKGL